MSLRANSSDPAILKGVCKGSEEDEGHLLEGGWLWRFLVGGCVSAGEGDVGLGDLEFGDEVFLGISIDEFVCGLGKGLAILGGEGAGMGGEEEGEALGACGEGLLIAEFFEAELGGLEGLDHAIGGFVGDAEFFFDEVRPGDQMDILSI